MSLRRKTTNILIPLLAFILASCGGVREPETYTSLTSLPRIYPDYTDTTIPGNIAPLNFMLPDKEDKECIVTLTSGRGSIAVEGRGEARFDTDEWHDFMKAAGRTDITVRVYVREDSGWQAYKPFKWHVAEDIDNYIAYRLIPPSYVCYEELHLCQRDLTSFETRDIYNNIDHTNGIKQCINCHSFQNYDTDRMQFHVRGAGGGTIVYDKGVVRKVNLKRDGCISSGVYPAWHPSLDLIAYSTNRTMQHFHTADRGKVEVQDSKSDLILYDVKADRVTSVSNAPYDLEVFPSWSPDGRWLYYSSATVADTAAKAIVEHYKEIRYNIYRRSFDGKSLQVGEPELVLDAASDSLSALLPRISPDGRFMLYSAAPYGVFHIWHEGADLYLMDLKTRQSHPLSDANSARAESYHSWSSNGRWIAFTSRRNDGNYTQIFFSYIDRDGRAHKAIQMPQEDPAHDMESTVGYNVPELTRTKVKTGVETFRRVLRK